MGDKRKSEVLDARDAAVLLFSWFCQLVEAATHVQGVGLDYTLFV
jgi:hypothetical protein